jgi:hypothetical protein
VKSTTPENVKAPQSIASNARARTKHGTLSALRGLQRVRDWKNC